MQQIQDVISRRDRRVRRESLLKYSLCGLRDLCARYIFWVATMPCQVVSVTDIHFGRYLTPKTFFSQTGKLVELLLELGWDVSESITQVVLVGFLETITVQFHLSCLIGTQILSAPSGLSIIVFAVT